MGSRLFCWCGRGKGGGREAGRGRLLGEEGERSVGGGRKRGKGTMVEDGSKVSQELRPDYVTQQFVQIYYQILSDRPVDLYRFYKSESLSYFADGPEEQATVLEGKENMDEGKKKEVVLLSINTCPLHPSRLAFVRPHVRMHSFISSLLAR